MSITTLVIIIGLAFPYEIRINYESASKCNEAMDNFYFQFYRKQDRELILPAVLVKCVKAGRKA